MNPTVILTVSNDLARDDGGWVLIAPYGDAHNVATLENVAAFRSAFPSVSINEHNQVDVVQRLTADNCRRLAEQFNGVFAKVKRFFRGAPIYLGHPDSPVTGSRYSDK